jgi:8-oxo-dGTP pyrophosphatase MutT (NUDIX family)
MSRTSPDDAPPSAQAREQSPFRVLSARQVYDNPWIQVNEHRILKPRGGEGIYGVVHFKNRAVGVVPYENGDVWIVGQYRFPLELYSWEIPEGGAPFDEDVEECARRELEEEAGLRAARLRKLFSMHLSNSVSDEIAHVYLATELSPGIAAPEDTEELRVRRIPLEELYSLVQAGTVTDAITVAAVFRMLLLRHEGAL